MKMILSLLLAAFGFNACAEVVIYKHRITATITGGGKVTRQALTGYTVFDREEADKVVMVLAQIRRGVIGIEKKFVEWHPQGVSVAQVSSAPTRSFTVFTQAVSWTDEDGFHTDTATVKGANSLIGINLGPTNQVFSYTGPRAMTWLSRSTYPAFPLGTSLEEAAGSLTLDVPLSKVANTKGDDVAAAVARVRVLLESAGYTEL